MIIDPNKLINASGMKIVLGIPYTRVTCTGTIDGTNKKYTLPEDYQPIYPAGHNGPLPTEDDIVIEGVKSGTPATYTVLPVTKLDTVENEILGPIYGAVELTTAIQSSAADSVVATGYEEVWARKAQDISPTLKQDTDDISEMGTDSKVTAYGPKSREIKADLTIPVDALKLIRKLFYKLDPDQTDVAEGYEKYIEREIPQEIKAYIPYSYEGSEVQRVYMDNVRIAPDLPSAKAGDATATITVDMTIPESFEIVVPKEV